MGGKPVPIVCPRGVSLREFRHEQRIQIAFSFRGVECRELLPPQKVTKSALVYASGLRVEVQRKIKDGLFLYADYFPGSDRAKQFAGGKLDPVKLGELMDAQLVTYQHQAENKKLSVSTLAGYKKAINSERMSQWRNKALDEVTPRALREWIGSFNTTAKFARNLIIPLRSIFQDALNDDLITFDPFDRIDLTKLLSQTARDSEYLINPFNADERALLIGASRPDEQPMVTFWFETGLRPSEIQALRWSRVDMGAAKILIDVVRVENEDQDRTKTEASTRWVRLSPAAASALVAQKLITHGAGDHVWHNPRKGKAWETADQIRKTMWIPLCSRAEITYRNPYQIRHTFASARLTEGENPWFVADQMGHVDVTMVFQTYGKFIHKDYQKPAVPPNLKAVG